MYAVAGYGVFNWVKGGVMSRMSFTFFEGKDREKEWIWEAWDLGSGLRARVSRWL